MSTSTQPAAQDTVIWTHPEDRYTLIVEAMVNAPIAVNAPIGSVTPTKDDVGKWLDNGTGSIVDQDVVDDWIAANHDVSSQHPDWNRGQVQAAAEAYLAGQQSEATGQATAGQAQEQPVKAQPNAPHSNGASEPGYVDPAPHIDAPADDPEAHWAAKNQQAANQAHSLIDTLERDASSASAWAAKELRAIL